MVCNNCSFKIDENTETCPKCGCRLNDKKKVKRVFNNIDEYSFLDDSLNDELVEKIELEELFQAYIGKNFDKLINGGYSFCTLFFSILYLIYRKLWLYAFVYLVIMILLFYSLNNYALIVIFLLNILLGFIFKKLYLYDVEVIVKRIKKKYPNKDLNELKKICRKKGGTSLIGVFVYFVLYFVVINVLFIYNVKHKTGTIIERIYMEVPNNFVKSAGKNQVFFTSNFENDFDKCLLSVHTIKGNLFDFDPKKYINYNSPFITNIPGFKPSEIKTVNINNYDWYYLTYSNSNMTQYYYSTVYKDYIYVVDFTIYYDFDNLCKSSFDSIMNSVMFK